MFSESVESTMMYYRPVFTLLLTSTALTLFAFMFISQFSLSIVQAFFTLGSLSLVGAGVLASYKIYNQPF